MSRESLLTQLRADEGLRLASYLCAAGHWTLGYGHNLEAHRDPKYPARAGTTCTLEQAEEWLRQDVDEAEAQMLLRWPWMTDLPDAVYDACLNLAFNMGVQTLSTFHRTLDALRAHSFGLAAHELENSKWFLQVGKRAQRVVAQVRSGGA